MSNEQIIERIRETVKLTASDATTILYGSYARNEQTINSDIDLLILLNRPKVSSAEIRGIESPLYDIEFETGVIISPIILTQNEWNGSHSITPFYKNVTNEGILL